MGYFTRMIDGPPEGTILHMRNTAAVGSTGGGHGGFLQVTAEVFTVGFDEDLVAVRPMAEQRNEGPRQLGVRVDTVSPIKDEFVGHARIIEVHGGGVGPRSGTDRWQPTWHPMGRDASRSPVVVTARTGRRDRSGTMSLTTERADRVRTVYEFYADLWRQGEQLADLSGEELPSMSQLVALADAYWDFVRSVHFVQHDQIVYETTDDAWAPGRAYALSPLAGMSQLFGWVAAAAAGDETAKLFGRDPSVVFDLLRAKPDAFGAIALASDLGRVDEIIGRLAEADAGRRREILTELESDARQSGFSKYQSYPTARPAPATFDLSEQMPTADATGSLSELVASGRSHLCRSCAGEMALSVLRRWWARLRTNDQSTRFARHRRWCRGTGSC